MSDEVKMGSVEWEQRRSHEILEVEREAEIPVYETWSFQIEGVQAAYDQLSEQRTITLRNQEGDVARIGQVNPDGWLDLYTYRVLGLSELDALIATLLAAKALIEEGQEGV